MSRVLVYLISISLLMVLNVETHAVDFTKLTIDSNFNAVEAYAADIDGDGDTDVVGADDKTGGIVWWENIDSDGNLWFKQTLDSTFKGKALVVADLDNDGDMDVVAAGSGSNDTVVLWENANGTGSLWNRHNVDLSLDGFDFPTSLAAADLNGDGHVDLVGSSFFKISRWRNPGAIGGNWYRRDVIETTALWTDIKVIDIDTDGDFDIAATAYSGQQSTGSLTVFRNRRGDGNAWDPTIVDSNTSHQNYGLDAGDFDGDGDIDLTSVTDGTLSWHEQQNNNFSWRTYEIDSLRSPEPKVATGDIDLDGDLDIVAVGKSFGTAWWENNSTLTPSWTKRTIDSGGAPRNVQTFDFSNNGDLDILTSSTQQKTTTLWKNTLLPDGGCVIPPGSNKAWYTFDETTGNIAYDIAQSNHGTHLNQPAKAAGLVKGALRFDGTNDHVAITDDHSLDFGFNDFSIEGWVKTTNSYGVIASKRAIIGSKYVGYLLMVQNGRLLLQIGDTTNSWMNYTSPSSTRINDNTWHHIAVTVDRNSSSGGRFYIDGERVSTFNPRARQGNTSNNATLDIGRLNGGGFYFKGTIDELAFYQKALNADDIQSINDAALVGKCKDGGPDPDPDPDPDPLSVNILCLSETNNIEHNCEAFTAGGSSPFSYNWSFLGTGTMSSNQNTATVNPLACDPFNPIENTLFVRVTDDNDAQTTDSINLACCDGFLCF